MSILHLKLPVAMGASWGPPPSAPLALESSLETSDAAVADVTAATDPDPHPPQLTFPNILYALTNLYREPIGCYQYLFLNYKKKMLFRDRVSLHSLDYVEQVALNPQSSSAQTAHPTLPPVV